MSFTAGLVVASFAGFREFLPGLLEGALVTIEITIGGCCSPWSWRSSRRSRRCTAPRPVRWLAVAYIEVFRGTSALVQLFWLFFVLPHFGVTLEPLTVAILALGLNVGAYGAEVVRGAVASVPSRPVGGRHRAQHEPRGRRSGASSCRRPSCG